ncbi:hypothetical protein [Piscibacillus salipiscarius]|nr:hypothetical protein [Piscibacillus salipiscarius]
MGKKAICEECGKTITSKNDLVTTTALLKLTTYCKDCYVERIKSFSSLFVSNTPLNGKYSNVMSVIV